jgi:hypothetical protein
MATKQTQLPSENYHMNKRILSNVARPLEDVRLAGSWRAIVVYILAGGGALVGGARDFSALTANAFHAVSGIVRQFVADFVLSSWKQKELSWGSHPGIELTHDYAKMVGLGGGRGFLRRVHFGGEGRGVGGVVDGLGVRR